MTSMTYGSSDFVTVMQGARVVAMPPDGSPDTSVTHELTGQPGSEFSRFVALTEGLLQVPTTEVDEQRAARLQRLADRSTSEDGMDWEALSRSGS